MILNFLCKRWRASSNLKKSALIILVLLVILSYQLGLHLHLAARSYYTDFRYPLDIPMGPLLEKLSNGEDPGIKPINLYNHRFKILNRNKCQNSDGRYVKVRLLIVVKSALNRVALRQTIRSTWGYEKRFSDVTIRRVFMLGTNPSDPELQDQIDVESSSYRDIVQADFLDTYFNNTVKTMLAYKWAFTNCPDAQYLLFADDDMYISVKNILKFIRNPENYNQGNVEVLGFGDNEFSDRMLCGYVFFSAPQRHLMGKWFVSLEEYPYSKYPPYVAGGAYILNFLALQDLYYTSMYTQHFRLDDVFVGILARKAEITPYHINEIHFYKKPYDKSGYSRVLASHGYSDPTELLSVWMEQKSLGAA
ncbi:B3GALT1 [Cordylochernes scorpioides]|uniref:Hexosyltransferase n=1 Tax=Cordylochernes scorpioides TaxID=51811 RepID=A0ABY6K210_9ARAC|nr:B3GALT1 [Cordylochernes scorpioides]